jgi:tetratricopeptide (TPR) repeat protein
VEIPPQTTIPVRKEALVSAQEAYGSRLEILENGQSAGIMSARPEMTPDTRKVRLALEIDAAGNVTWSRESVGEAVRTPSGGTPAASGAAARTGGNAAAGPAAKAAFRAMPAREVRKLLADASACREKGDYKGEQRILLQAANGAPDDPDVLIRLGRCYADNGQPRTAIGLYEKVQFLKPDYPTAYSNAGAAYFRLGEVDRAIPLYRRAIAMIGKGPSASNRAENGVTYANAAMVFSKRKHDPKEIRALLTKAEQCGYDTKNLRKLLKI